MQVAIASGKGGTGKTTLATNLAELAAARDINTTYVDCDVEEPNGHLFLHPTIVESEAITRRFPQVDPERCKNCRACERICQYSAIVCVGEKPLVFFDLCHSCGGCALVCPENAIAEVARPIGTVRRGYRGALQFVDGTLEVGQSISPPAIRRVKAVAPQTELMILDAPPGTTCPVVETVRDADYVLLVTEPTPFGLQDLKLAIEMLHVLKRPAGVVINRCDLGHDEVRAYCAARHIPILAEIPNDRTVAETYAQGNLAVHAIDAYRDRLEALLDSLLETAVAQ